MSTSPEPLLLSPADEYEADEAIARLTELVRRLRDIRRDRLQSGLRLDLGFRGQRFVAPWKRSEQFFRNGLGTTPLDVDDPDLQRFLSKWATGPLCYGFPCYVNEAGHVLPLLFCDVRLRIGGGQIQVQLDRDSKPQINQRVLIEHGFDRSLTDSLTEDLTKKDFDSFDSCLAHVAELLGAKDALFRAEHLEPWPLEDRTVGWRNTPILFAPVEEQNQASIAAELQAIELTIEQASKHTSLHAFFDHSPGSIDREVEPLAPFAADTGRVPVLEDCLSATLTYLTAPPGSGRLPFIGNLIASQIGTGGSVLFVSPHGHVIDQVSGQLEAMLQRTGCWIHRLEKRGASEELARSFAGIENFHQDGETAGSAPRPPVKPVEKRATAATDHLSEVDARLNALYQAQWRYSVARTKAAEILQSVAALWVPLFKPHHELSIDRSGADELIDRAHGLSDTTKSQGFRRLLGKPDDQPAFDDVVRAIVGAIAPVPRSVAEPIETELASAASAKDVEVLTAASRALLAFVGWKEAIARSDEALSDLQQFADVRVLARHFAAAQSVVNKSDRVSLSQHWHQRIAQSPSDTANRIEAFTALHAERQGRDRTDDWLDRKLTQSMRDIFPAVPVWTGRIESVVGRLPLEPALFDLVIVEDAQSVDAGALFPLLFRSRQAVVIGTRAPPGHHDATAAGLMCETSGGKTLGLTECARGHPAITWSISQLGHAGTLKAISNADRLTDGVDPSLVGLHWHPCTAESGQLSDRQLDSVIRLVGSWHDLGLFNAMPPKMVGIACSSPARRGLLMGALANLLPKSMVLERIAVAGPERFHSQVVDFLIIVPQQDGEIGSERSQRLAQSPLLFHDALGAARIGAHIVADEKTAKADGGLLAVLADVAHALEAEEHPIDLVAQSDLTRLTDLLGSSGIAHHRTNYGLMAFGQLGTVYEFVLPGKQKVDEDTGTVIIHLIEEDLAEPEQRLAPLLARLA